MIVERFEYQDGQALFNHVESLPWSQYFDSGVLAHSEQVSKNAKYDVIVCKPVATLVCDGLNTKIECSSGESNKKTDPLSLLRELLSNELGSTNNDLQGYGPGAYGYLSYDYARMVEDISNIAIDSAQLPVAAFGIYDTVVVIDHLQQEIRLLSLNAESACFSFWKGILNKKFANTRVKDALDLSCAHGLQAKSLSENLDHESYGKAFERVQDYIFHGDCYQVNLAKQFSADVQGNAWHTYGYLRQISPAPYAAFMRFPFADVLSNSPESFIQCRSGKVTTSPIKGTSPRDHSNALNDLAIADQLLNSPKDRAENLMIVDLMRNDLSRCCKPNSVKVDELFKVHSFANVHHLISRISGELNTGVDVIDLLKSCFPGGSITGAPKIRAMQIIEELEPDRRGLYCGAITYVGADGDMESNIAIRTITIKDGVARYGAGGGLVVDSDVNQEHQEILDKAKMMKLALYPKLNI